MIKYVVGVVLFIGTVFGVYFFPVEIAFQENFAPHMEGLLHFYAILATVSIVILGLDRLQEGGIVRLNTRWVDAAKANFSTHAEQMGFDDKKGWPQVLSRSIQAFEEDKPGVTVDSAPFLLIEYFLLDASQLESDGKFYENKIHGPSFLNAIDPRKRNPLVRALWEHKCLWMDFIHKGAYGRMIASFFAVTIAVFLILCLISTFPPHIDNVGLQEFWLKSEVLIYLWGLVNLLVILLPSFFVPRLEPMFEFRLQELWDRCDGCFSGIETAGAADEPLSD